MLYEQQPINIFFKAGQRMTKSSYYPEQRLPKIALKCRRSALFRAIAATQYNDDNNDLLRLISDCQEHCQFSILRVIIGQLQCPDQIEIYIFGFSQKVTFIQKQFNKASYNITISDFAVTIEIVSPYRPNVQSCACCTRLTIFSNSIFISSLQTNECVAGLAYDAVMGDVRLS